MQVGSLIEEGDMLTNLSDNNVMWVYFYVPEKRYLEYKALQSGNAEPSKLELVDSRIELQLADQSIFDQKASNTVTVEGKFNNEVGVIPFRADFPNPNGLLRHGQTGNVLIPPAAESRSRHPPAGHVRDSRQGVRVRHRQG